MDKVIENNQAVLSGEIVSNFEFSHEVFGEGFYISYLSSDRTSGKTDVIPIMVSDRLAAVHDDWTGHRVKVLGQFRSYNKHDGKKKRLILSLFVRRIKVLEDDVEKISEDENRITIKGFICKEPIYRETPLGREIADILVAVNRPYGKTDYIPCICWGRNAKFASDFQVGDGCMARGRIQSREYIKKISETEIENRVAYEVSASKIELIEEG